MTAQGCHRTVLVIEDDGDIRDAIGELLEDRNYRPLLASNGAAALAELRAVEPKPCLILLDVMMPIMDGRTFRAQQQTDPALNEIPVVVLSAHADASAAAVEMKADGFLKKPIDLRRLLETVDRFCAHDLTPPGAAPAS
ncbi:MAG TPA: response regulator [Myxococcales bacterium]|nr:response regulator [Myxococcales bacterium]